MIHAKERNIGLEYLRIFSMYLIILLHSIDHSGLLERLVPGTALYVWERLFYSLCQVCVNCFVMLSGYFLVESKFRLSKLLTLWFQVVFYSLSIKLILMALGRIPFSLVSLASCFAPVLTGRYWFVTIYFGLYLIFPFLNILIRAMDRQQHSTLNLLLIMLMSLMVSIHPAFAGMNAGAGWGLSWFVVLYLLAAWLRRYGIPGHGKHAGTYALGYLLCAMIPWISTLTADALGLGILRSIAGNWYRYDSVFACLGAICLFCAFCSCSTHRISAFIPPSWIMSLSASTFGIYLIHAHANVCIEPLWQALGILSYSEKLWFPLYQLGLAALIFLICAGVDRLCQQLFRCLKLEQHTAFICTFAEIFWDVKK